MTPSPDRADYWASQGDPPRPPKTAADYFEERPTCTLEPLDNNYGALSKPAVGFTPEEWRAIGHEEQKAARERQWQEAAKAQVEWEANARGHAGVRGED